MAAFFSFNSAIQFVLSLGIQVAVDATGSGCDASALIRVMYWCSVMYSTALAASCIDGTTLLDISILTTFELWRIFCRQTSVAALLAGQQSLGMSQQQHSTRVEDLDRRFIPDTSPASQRVPKHETQMLSYTHHAHMYKF